MDNLSETRPERLEMELPCEAARVTDVRHAVAEFARTLGMTQRTVQQLEVVVSEAVANCVRHAYCPSDSRPMVQVACSSDGEYLTIEVVDQGCGFAAPADGVVPEVDMDRDGGLGIILIKRFMDNVSYDSSQGRGTRLSMAKRLPARARKKSPRSKLSLSPLLR